MDKKQDKWEALATVKVFDQDITYKMACNNRCGCLVKKGTTGNTSELLEAPVDDLKSDCSSLSELDWPKFRHEFQSMLNTWRHDIDNKISKINKNIISALSEIRDEINSLQTDQNKIKSNITSLSEDYTELQNSYQHHVQQQAEAQEKLDNINILTHTLVPTASVLTNLEHLIDCLEQQARQCDIEIINIPAQNKENLKLVFSSIGFLIGYPIMQEDIISIHRVPHANQENGKPENIIVKVSTSILRNNILRAFQKLRSLKSDAIGISGPSHNIYMNEHLTLKNKELLRRCRDLAKKHNYNVWVENGTVFLSWSEDSIGYAVRFAGVTHHSPHESVLPQSMQQVEVVQSTATTPISLLVQSLVKQLCSLLEKDIARSNQLYNTICEKLHSMNLIDDSYAMGEFEVMRSQYQRALYQLVTVASGSEIPITLPVTWPITRSGLEWSRYHKEFEELYYIAAGGFGSVFKARHRLDGVEYAVKKVYIKSSDVNSVMTHLSEVKTIANLNHPNIVNYKAAWLEPMIESMKKKRKFKMDTDSHDFSYNSDQVSSVYPNMKSFKTYNSNELDKKQSQSDFTISFKNSNSLELDHSVSSDEMDSGSDYGSNSSNGIEQNAVCQLISNKEYENCSRVNLKWATLYIQMTFCQQTLKQWLDERNCHMASLRKNSDDLTLHHSDSTDSTDSQTFESAFSNTSYPLAWTRINVVVDMFTQLVRGLHYIHSKGIIHHDVKPSNVFVGQNESGLVVQLGDFGLACPLQQSHSGLALGTHSYAAPEQLEGQCNPKSDMYSLGIILLEMVEPFSTDMERVKTITDLRKGQIPAHLTANYPKLAHIIGKLVQRRPNKRLDTNQLLEELKNLSENKDAMIKTLKEELAAKEDEIAKLKMMLANVNFRN